MLRVRRVDNGLFLWIKASDISAVASEVIKRYSDQADVCVALRFNPTSFNYYLPGYDHSYTRYRDGDAPELQDAISDINKLCKDPEAKISKEFPATQHMRYLEQDARKAREELDAMRFSVKALKSRNEGLALELAQLKGKNVKSAAKTT